MSPRVALIIVAVRLSTPLFFVCSNVTHVDLRYNNITEIGLSKLIRTLKFANFGLLSINLQEERKRSKESLTNGLPSKAVKQIKSLLAQNAAYQDVRHGHSAITPSVR